MSKENKYPVNGEGWRNKDALFRCIDGLMYREYRTDLDAISGENNIAEVMVFVPIEEANQLLIEQRYTDQQIELLQKDEGWISWSAGDEYPDIDKGAIFDFVHTDGNILTECENDNLVCWDNRSQIVAYRLTNDDLYHNGERVVLREGDYVDEKTTRDEYDRCFAVFDRLSDEAYGTWNNADNISVITFNDGVRARQLTLDQVLNAENAKVDKGQEQFAAGMAADIQEHENDAPEPEWKEGELPPSGTRCEYKKKRDYKKCRIIFLGERYAIVNNAAGFELALCLSSTKFRPIKSHRDKVVEKAARALQKHDQDITELCNKSLDRFIPVAEYLCDLDMLKLPEED